MQTHTINLPCSVILALTLCACSDTPPEIESTGALLSSYAVESPEVLTPHHSSCLHYPSSDLTLALEVAPDGTLQIRNEEVFLAMVGEDWVAATNDLVRVNQRVRDGEMEPFTPERLTRVSRSGGPQAAYGWGECEDECNWAGLCCCDKWWIFCLDECFCTP